MEYPTTPDHRGAYGYLVVRRDTPSSKAFEAGDEVITYPLNAPAEWMKHVTTSSLTPSRVPNPHALARLVAGRAETVLEGFDRLPRLRQRCSCRRGRKLADVYQERTTKHLWALIKPQLIPAAFMGSRPTDPTFWPFHQEQNGAPHHEFVKCSCGKHWAVLLRDDRIATVPLGRPVPGRVGP